MVGVIGAALIPLAPVVASLLLILLRYPQRLPFWHAGSRLWVAVLLPGVLLILMLRGGSAFSSEDLGALVTLTLFGIAFGTTQRYMGKAVLISVLVLGGLLGLERYVATYTWHESLTSEVAWNRYRAVLQPQRIQGTANAAWSERRWRGLPSTDSVLFRFETRLIDGLGGRAWIASTEGFVQEPSTERPHTTRVHPPAGGEGYLARRIYTGAPLAGRTFLVDVEIRSPDALSFADTSCRGVILREVAGSDSAACFAHEISDQWQTLSFEWTPPSTAFSELLSIELRIPETWFEVGLVTVSESTPTGAVSLGALDPAGVRVAFAPAGTAPISWTGPTIPPSSDWTLTTIPVPETAINSSGELRVLIRPEPNTEIAVRNVELESTDGPIGVAVAQPQRGRLWFAHSNLAAHALAAATIVAATGFGAALGQLAILVTGMIGVSFTGSRTAFAALLVTTLLLLLRQAVAERKPKILIPAMLVVLAAGLLANVGPLASRFDLLANGDGNQVSRTQIWTFALNQTLSDPFGQDGRSFQEKWSDAHPDDIRPPPTHAHNFWLQFGSSYGVAGLLWAIAFSLSAIFLSRPRIRAIPVLGLAGLLTLQLSDYTLTSLPVMICLVLLLDPSRWHNPTSARAKYPHQV